MGRAPQLSRDEARLRRVEEEAGARAGSMEVYGREHAAVDRKVREIEAELEDLRRRRIETYAEWWNAREDRDRSLHIARRLRRRLERARRRGAEIEVAPEQERSTGRSFDLDGYAEG